MRALAAAAALILAIPLPGATEKRIDPPPAQAKQRAVDLDVKDEEAGAVLRSLQRQCGIRNLMIDPAVGGKATFYFRQVPCRDAFDAVLKTYGLRAIVYSDTVAAVEKSPLR